MRAITRRGLMSGFAAVGLGAMSAACSPSSSSVSRQSLADFGAVADGVYDPVTRRASGTDNTAAVNAALASGSPVTIPPGYFYYSGTLHTETAGSGLVGSGSAKSFLITDRSLHRHIAVVGGTRHTTWTNFSMIGPHINNGDRFNRALTIGTDRTLAGLASSQWDAGDTWVDDFVTRGYCVGLHVADAANVGFGTIEVLEAGDSRAEPGSYGITCSGSKLRGSLLRAINTTTRARHALYYTGPANDCFVDVVEARGFDFAPIRNRATEGGGRRNGFGRARLEDCNTNSSGGPDTVRGLVDFVCADDVVVAGAGKARIGDYVAINCGGIPGPSLRYMPNSQCKTVEIYNNSPIGNSTRIGTHIYRSENVELPRLVYADAKNLDVAERRDSDFNPIVVEDSPDCYGGGVEFRP